MAARLRVRDRHDNAMLGHVNVSDVMGRAVTPNPTPGGCQIGSMDHTGCYVDHTGCHQSVF
jgi:hypothetical protein